MKNTQEYQAFANKKYQISKIMIKIEEKRKKLWIKLT